MKSISKDRALLQLANTLEGLARRAGAQVRPSHVDYISKADIALVAAAVAADIRTLVESGPDGPKERK